MGACTAEGAQSFAEKKERQQEQAGVVFRLSRSLFLVIFPLRVSASPLRLCGEAFSLVFV